MERYVDGEADDIDREIVESHLEVCGECAREIEELRRCVVQTGLAERAWERRVAAMSVTQAMPPAAAPVPMIRAASPAPPPRQPRRWGWWVVIAVIVVVVLLWWWLRSP